MSQATNQMPRHKKKKERSTIPTNPENISHVLYMLITSYQEYSNM